MRRSRRSVRRRAPRRRVRRSRPSRPSRVRRTTTRMSRRRVLNITTVKKQDNMLNWVPTTASNPAGGGSPTDYITSADSTVHSFLFCPTYRQLSSDPLGQDDSSGRTKQNTFARGYRETSTLRVAGPTPFRMRRIVFAMKAIDPALIKATSSLFTTDFYQHATSGTGYTRLMADLSSTSFGVAPVTEFLFKGLQNADWYSPFNAKLDTQRVTVVSDRTYNINPGNQAGRVVILKNWYSLNKRLLYADDEAGNGEYTSGLSTYAKPGMGDLLVLDFLQSIVTDTNTSIAVNHEGSYYWHER